MNSVSSDSIVDNILQVFKNILGEPPVGLHEPTFEGNEWKYLKECLDSTFVSSVGKYVDLFEAQLAEFTGAKHAVAVVNGTAALHIALKLSGVSPGSEVLLPAFTFVATANAVTYCQAKPHFIDIEEKTLGICPASVYEYLKSISEMRGGKCFNRQTGCEITAMIAMHSFGHPVDIEGILKVSRDFNIPVVEDAAEALGSYSHGEHVGHSGLIGALSFNGNKIITTGGGGAILTDNQDLAARAKHLTTTAKTAHPWEYRHDAIGFNYRLPNINAALGCAQLESLPQKLQNKRKLFNRYKNAFEKVSGISIFEEPENCKSNYWLQAILLNEDDIVLRNEILDYSNKNGYCTRPAWELLSTLDPYINCQKMDLINSKSVQNRLINIPSSAHL